MFDFLKNFGSTTTNGSDLSNVSTGLSGVSGVGPLSKGSVGGTGLDVSQSAAGSVAKTAGTANTGGSFLRTADGSLNTDNIGMVFGGVQALGNLWNSYQQHKIAKKGLALQERAFETNLANSTQTYNTALEDRIRARHFTEGKGQGATDSYLAEHSL